MNKQEIKDKGRQLLSPIPVPAGRPRGLDLCNSGSASSAALTPKGTCFLLNGRPGGERWERESQGRSEEKHRSFLPDRKHTP